ncbi:Gfo/Idh/MocA family protein [Bryobacter aggregatus]|uniref:Gfo/Idh/MocA family protein n=1 Tax=Bryobacter aggregatus TaxID=360054 RepID=UPI001EE3548C|nr:Gfo/Idh/MocA family oxidoreductase [Bryobacter aggregatus]
MQITRRTAMLSAVAYSNVLGANDRINVGLIGCGNLGMRHLRIYQKPMLEEGKIHIAGISDIYTGAKRRGAAQVKLETKDIHHDYQELIARKDIDAIMVVTPEHWHHKMTIAALNGGKDVYLEKPMTFTIAEAKDIDETVKRTGRVLQIGAQWCSDPRYHRAKEIVEKGWLGNILFAQSTYSMNSVYGLWEYDIEAEASAQTIDWPRFLGSAPKRPYSGERYFRWRKYWDYSNGVVSDFMYHRLAPMMLTLGGRFPNLVSANGGVYQFKDREVPETFTMTAEYDSFFVTVASSAASIGPERHHGPAIYGHEATLAFYDGSITVTPDRQFRKKFEAAAGKPELKIECMPKDLNEIRINHARNFYDCMRTRQQPILNSHLGYQVMTAIKLASDSYRERRMMAFDPKTEKVLAKAPPRVGYEGDGKNYQEPT